VYLDLDSIEQVGYRHIAPMIEVYALTSNFTGTYEPSNVIKTTRVIRPVPLGENQRVVLDITPIVREHLRSPTTNHGLILGCFSGWKEGDFELKRGSFENASDVRIRAYLSPRYE
jgi:hypothetical protein